MIADVLNVLVKRRVIWKESPVSVRGTLCSIFKCPPDTRTERLPEYPDDAPCFDV